MNATQIAAQRREELAQLVSQNGGAVTPAQVVDYARNPDTALHTLFLWDDTDAARLYREQQAAKYLRAVVTLVPRRDGEAMVVRAFVSLSADRGESGVYRPITSVLSDDEQRAQLLSDALRELNALRVKYGHLQELAGVWDALPVPMAVAA